MLDIPGPPKILPAIPSLKPGEQAMPRLGEKLLYRVGASVLGIPGSPGTTHPSGAVGNCVDCKPGTMVSILPCVSYHGMLTSQRTPRLRVRFGLTLKVSSAKAPP